MRKEKRTREWTGAGLLAVATVAVYATEWLAFLWPVMTLVDAQYALAWRRRRRTAQTADRHEAVSGAPEARSELAGSSESSPTRQETKAQPTGGEAEP